MAEEPADVPADVPVAPEPVEVVDVQPRRVRRPLDLVRVVGLPLILAVIAGLGTVARDTVAGANSDVTRLVGEVPHLLFRALSLVATVGALALPVALASANCFDRTCGGSSRGWSPDWWPSAWSGRSTSRSRRRRPRRCITR